MIEFFKKIVIDIKMKVLPISSLEKAISELERLDLDKEDVKEAFRYLELALIDRKTIQNDRVTEKIISFFEENNYPKIDEMRDLILSIKRTLEMEEELNN